MAERATLRDLMKLQEQMFEEVKNIHDEIAGLKVKVAIISSGIAFAVSIITTILTIISFLKGVK